MTNTVVRFRESRVEAEDICSVAKVVEAEQGQALSVMLADGQVLDVHGHLSEVSVLNARDQVLVQRTAVGLVVTGRLRADGESACPLVQERNGRFILDAAAGICLQAGDARIELTPDGRIHVDGREIYNIASGRVRLQGTTVEIN
jgi:hypothetical protein